MDGIWIGAISALSGVAVSGIVSSWRSRSEFRREKAWALQEQLRGELLVTFAISSSTRSGASAVSVAKKL